MTKNFNPALFVSQENWDEKDFRSMDDVVHGYALSVAKLTPDEKSTLIAYLAQKKIFVKERESSVETKHIKKGESYLRVSDPNSIFNLCAYEWKWCTIENQCEEENHTAVGHKPIVEKLEDFEQRKKLSKQSELARLNDQEIRNSVEAMMKDPDLKKRLMSFLIAEELRVGKEQWGLKIDRPNVCQMLKNLKEEKAPTPMRQMAQRALVKEYRKVNPKKTGGR